jgi:hypothetical protein
LGHYPIILGIPWLKQYNVTIRFVSNIVTFGSQYCLAYYNERAVKVYGTSKDTPEPLTTNTILLSITMIRPVLLTHQAKHNQLQIYIISLYEINKVLKQNKETNNILYIIPPEYYKFLPLFSEVKANILLLYYLYNYWIPLKEGFIPLFGLIYSLLGIELEALKK